MANRDFSVTIDIATPADRAWAVTSDVERWSEWTPSINRLILLDPAPLAVGSRARIWQPKLPPALWTVIDLDRGRSFTWKSGSPAAWATGKHLVEPTPHGCRATLSLHFGGPLGGIAGWFLRSINISYLKLEAEGLKARSENPAAKFGQ